MIRLSYAAILLLSAASAMSSRPAAAEDFRVFTVLYNLSAEDDGQRPPVIARAVTLFHAGKAYDYVDVADEIIVFEPTRRRFRVLDRSAGVVATVEFDEIKHLLQVAHEETQRQAEALSNAESLEAGRLLRFQLDPRFEETFSESDGLLMLKGDQLEYTARSVSSGRPGAAATYLEYADWVCRLNYLLHPGPLLPQPRLALNASLRAKDRLPAMVELRAAGSPGRHLKAEHAIDFDLNTQERSWIHQWESQLKTARQVPLREYQRMMLTSR